MKLIFLTLILCTNIFGATVVQPHPIVSQEIVATPNQPPHESDNSNAEQIAELEQVIIDLALPKILENFPAESHESIKPSIEKALDMVDRVNIIHIIKLLPEVLPEILKSYPSGINPDIIMALIIGMNASLNLSEPSDKNSEEQEPVNALGENNQESPPTGAPVASPAHAPVKAQLAVQQKDPSPVAAHPPLKHQATRNKNLKIGI